MAFPSAGTIWEPRATGNNTLNGSGFDPSFGGVDYSQQDAPQQAYTDIALTQVAGIYKYISSVIRPFVGQDKGNIIYLASGNAERYQIVDVNAGIATLHEAAYSAGQTGLTGRLGGGSPSFLTSFQGRIAPDNVVWLKGLWNTAAGGNGSNININGTGVLPIRIRGYGSVRGDGARATIQGISGNTTTMWDMGSGSHIFLQDLEFDLLANNFGVRGVACGPNQRFENCIFGGNNVAVQTAGTLVSFRKCWFKNSGQVGLKLSSAGGVETPIWVEYCRFSGIGRSGQDGVAIDDIYGGLDALENLFDHCYIGIRRGAAFKSRIRRNVFDFMTVATMQMNNANAGVALAETRFRQNVISNSPIGIDNLSGITPAAGLLAKNYGGNAFYNVTAHYTNMGAAPDDTTLTADPYGDSAGGDYRPNSLPGGGLSLRAMEEPGDFADGLQTILGEVGFAAATSGGGGGGGIIDIDPPIADFDEVRLPEDISQGATGGPSYKTIITITGSSSEQRNAQWNDPLYKWSVGYGARDIASANTLMAFFLARQGKARGFRFKDWQDYRMTLELTAAVNSTQFQIVKTYTSGPVSKVRKIKKPVAGTVHVFNASSVEVMSGWTVDTTTGVVEFSVAPGYIPKVTCEFDVPVRFDTDEMGLVQLDVTAREWLQIPIVELKF